MQPFVALLFFLSGTTGLVYEVLWSKHLAFFFGNAAHANAIVLATFLGGLALGNALLGRVADRLARPLAAYGWIEIGVGVFAGLSPWMLEALGALYMHLARDASPAVAVAIKAPFAVAALLLPTALMGGSLPLLARFTTRSLETLKGNLAGLYALNSLGAFAGVLAAGFWLIPRFGLEAPMVGGAIANVAIGLAALALAGRLPEAAPQPGPAAKSPTDEPAYTARQIRVLLAAIALSGAIAMAYEIAWIRLLALVLGSSTYAFSLMLAAFIGGIALGSMAIRRWRLPGKSSLGQFAIAQLGVAGTIMLTLPLYERLPYLFAAANQALPHTPAGYPLYMGLQFAFCFALMLVPTTFLGMTLPLASRVATRAPGEVGSRVGQVFSLNTLGNVIGAIAATALLLPWLGVRGLIEAGVLANLAIAIATLAVLPGLPRPRTLAVAGVPVLAFIGLKLAFGSWDPLLLAIGTFRDREQVGATFEAFKQAQRDKILQFYRDDAHATVAVYQGPDYLTLSVNGKPDASVPGDLGTQILLGHLPFLLNPAARDVYMIGFGSGISAASALTHPIERLDLAEISPAVIAAGDVFSGHNRNVLGHPRLHVHVDDALSHLRRQARRYDAIITEPSNPWMAGVGNLFTVEAYRAMRDRLAPGGVVAQWFHAYDMDDANFAMIVRTLRSVFPHVTLWQPQGMDMVLLATLEPQSLDAARAAAMLEAPAVREDLSRLGLGRLTSLLGLQMASARRLEAIAPEGALNTLKHPRLEYEAPLPFFLKASAQAPYALDERSAAPSPADGTLLGRHLRDRGRPLTADELAERYDYLAGKFHPWATDALRRSLLASWAERFPGDRRPTLLLAAVLREEGEIGRALALVRRFRETAPADRAIAEAEAELTFRQLSSPASVPGALQAAIEAHERLLALVTHGRGPIYAKLAAVYQEAGNAPRVFRYTDMAAEAILAEPDLNGRRALIPLWLNAAQTARDVGELRQAGLYLTRVLQLDPQEPLALKLASEILSRAGQ